MEFQDVVYFVVLQLMCVFVFEWNDNEIEMNAGVNVKIAASRL